MEPEEAQKVATFLHRIKERIEEEKRHLEDISTELDGFIDKYTEQSLQEPGR